MAVLARRIGVCRADRPWLLPTAVVLAAVLGVTVLLTTAIPASILEADLVVVPQVTLVGLAGAAIRAAAGSSSSAGC